MEARTVIMGVCVQFLGKMGRDLPQDPTPPLWANTHNTRPQRHWLSHVHCCSIYNSQTLDSLDVCQWVTGIKKKKHDTFTQQNITWPLKQTQNKTNRRRRRRTVTGTHQPEVDNFAGRWCLDLRRMLAAYTIGSCQIA